MSGSATTTISPPDFEYLRRLVHERAAIVLENGKEYLAESRLLPLARREGCTSLQELVSRLRGASAHALQRTVVEAMTTNETSFFRDVHPFEALARHVLPALTANRAAERAITIWCGACSTGQEPYSIAMLLRERCPALAGWRISILATDLSTEVLARARAGRFSQIEVNRGLPATLLVKYFTRDGVHWVLKEEVRRMVEFREMNLAEPWPSLARMDIVFLRNVLIYFSVETKKMILGRIRRQLRPDGYLFLGGAETTLNLDDGFERVAVERAAYYRARGS